MLTPLQWDKVLKIYSHV